MVIVTGGGIKKKKTHQLSLCKHHEHQVHEILYRWQLLLCAPTWRLLAHVHFKFQTALSFTQCLVQKVKVQFNSIQIYSPQKRTI